MTTFDPDKLRLSIARDLRQVEQLCIELHWQIEASPNARDFPGGTALHMAGPGVVLQDWERQYEATEERERWDVKGNDHWTKLDAKGNLVPSKLDPASYQGDDEAQPLNVLCFWTRVIREERDQPTNLKPTISREVDYLRKQLDWMLRDDEYGEPMWPEVFEAANDVRGLVRALENTLHAGSRLDRSASSCFQLLPPDETRCGGELVRFTIKRVECIHARIATKTAERTGQPANWVLAHTLAHNPTAAAEHKECDQGGRDDIYRCLKCEKKYTPAEYWLAVKDGYERNVG